ncbi:hypothetical protein BSL78_24615 [Apostichopus japonicus]|uniref:SUEL-type lectin domain-containing protein n=1 Tax=Stichopus japonicus TaxID=307972 RepID=A0A2G8JS62_STIJA|nr:hypothetical protein BSL78_24615 [Apostichopus japonicus]
MRSVGEQTVNACQDEDLEIACDDGYINIVDAIYGRVVDDICADDGQAASSDCQSPDAKSKAIETCQGRESCSLPATNYVFGDPCSYSSKYLQVTYACDADPYGGTIRPAPFVETEYTIDTPGEYTFLEYEFQHKCLYLVFGVKAKANAFITLSPSQGLEDNIYEVRTDTSFSGSHFAKAAWLLVFYGDNSPLAAYVDEDPFDVSYVGFTTFGVESQWIFYLEHFGAFLLESNNRQSPFYPDVVLDAASGYEFEFIIRGDEDATLWLTPRPYADYEDALLVHIGSHGNTYNYIEYQGQVVVSSHGALLNGKEDRVFKLKYSANKIQLLNGDGYVILEAAGIPADNVIYLGFHSPDGISYWWLYDLYFPFTVSDDGHSWSGNSFSRSYGCSSEISLDCGEKYIYIYDASYGRQNNRICRYDPIYQTDGCYSDHTVDYVRENCHNKQTCTYDASVLESYCHETTKYFQWTYVCVNEVITNRIVESYPSSQPQPPSEDNVFETTESTEDFTFPLPKLQDDSYFIYFCVKSSAEVRIALSSENEVQDDMYIIAITATSVSIAQGSNVPTEAAAEDLLASNEYRCFWIAFYNGQIAIGRYGDYYPLLLNQETGAVAPGISYVGIASSAPDAAWRVYTEGSGEYKYKSDRSRLYSPNLANLPQRMFKFCFGIKAEGSAVLRVGPEDYDEGGYPLIISIGSAGNTKITLQYSDWSAELEEASVLSTDTVRYFCLVLLDDCISLLDEDGNVLLEGVDVVDYRYLRRISFYNIDYVGYWYIRGIPFRFPGAYLF